MMRQRVVELIEMTGDCTEAESAEIKRLLDEASLEEIDALCAVWPLEYDEWWVEIEEGYREVPIGMVRLLREDLTRELELLRTS